MKNIRKIMMIFLAVIIAFSAAACDSCGDAKDNNTTEPIIENKVLELDQNSVTLRIGETVTVTANIDDVLWKSESDRIAVVVDGNITGISAGDTVVTATYKDQVKSVAVTVSGNTDYTAYPVLAFESKASSVVKDYSFNLDACVMYAGEIIADCPISFSSSDTAVLTVSNAGVVTAVAAGTATVTATATYEGELLSETLTIKVVDSVMFITFNNVGSEYVLKMGESYLINATLKSFTETFNSSLIEWESENPSVVSVSDGTINGLSVGSATVYAKYQDVILNSCDVEVRRYGFNFEIADEDLKSVSCNFGSLAVVDYATENSDGKLDFADMDTEPYLSATASGNMLKWYETGTQDSRQISFDFGRTLAKGTKIKFKFFAYNPNTTDHFWFKLGCAQSVGTFTDQWYWSNGSSWGQHWKEFEITLNSDTDSISFFTSYGAGMCSTNFGDPVTDRNALVYYVDDFRIVE